MRQPATLAPRWRWSRRLSRATCSSRVTVHAFLSQPVRHDGGMGLLCDYFVAPSDDDAAATIDRDTGPGRPAPPKPAPRGGLFRRRTQATPSAGNDVVYPTVDGGGIEPSVQMGRLEALLTGRTIDEVLEANLPEQVIAERFGGERVVVRLSDALTSALADASDADLAKVAEPWSQTEEFWGHGDPSDLAQLLGDLAELARQGRERGEALYCRVVV